MPPQREPRKLAIAGVERWQSEPLTATERPTKYRDSGYRKRGWWIWGGCRTRKTARDVRFIRGFGEFGGGLRALKYGGIRVNLVGASYTSIMTWRAPLIVTCSVTLAAYLGSSSAVKSSFVARIMLINIGRRA